MKKLLVIAVIFALVSSAAFAEVSIGGQVQWGYTFLHGYPDPVDSGEVDDDGNAIYIPVGDDSNYFGGRQAFSEQHLQVSVSGDNAGAYFRFKNGSVVGRYTGFAHVWWAPIEQVRIDLGDDGFGGRDGITGWGYLGPAKIGGALAGPAYQNEGGGTHLGPTTYENIGFYTGTGWNVNIFGLTFNFVENLTIKAAVKNFANGEANFDPEWGNKFGDPGILLKGDDFIPNLTFQVIYNIEGIGSASLAADLNTGKELTSKGSTGTKIFADFLLNEAIEGLELQLGVAFTLPTKIKDQGDYQPATEIGLGAVYSAGDFGIKARIAVIVGEEFKPKSGDTQKGDTTIGIGILPYYNIADGVTIYGNIGFNIFLPDSDGARGGGDDGKDAVVGWYVNPYVSIPTGCFDLWVGLKLYSNGWEIYGDKGDSAKVCWAVPIGLQVNF